MSLADVRRLWPEVVNATKSRRRVTWIHLTENAQVVAVDVNTLTLGFANTGARESFVNGGSVEIVQAAALAVLGRNWRIEAIVDPGARGGGDAYAAPAPQAPAAPQQAAPQAPPAAPSNAPYDAPEPPPAYEPPPPPDPREEPHGWGSEAPTPAHDPLAAARAAISPTRTGGEAPVAEQKSADLDSHVRSDDPEMEESGMAARELLENILGATVVQEIKND